ncbi:hypothetical protein ACIRSU_11135 [Streptomyces sp. NPDC101160]
MRPSETVKSDAWWGSFREDEKVFLPGVWIGIGLAVFILVSILTHL